jgi:hypothetical protein
MSAAPAGHAARKLAADLFSPTTQKPLQSLLSQVYGKPVELNLVNLKRPHLNSDILASLVTQKLKDRANTPRRVIRDVVWKAQLPIAQSQVPSQADHAIVATKALAKDPSTSSMARAKAPIGHIMHSLRLKQVSSIAVGANGRLGKRMTANRADKKTARKGLTSKGPGFLVRGVRKNHTDYSFRAARGELVPLVSRSRSAIHERHFSNGVWIYLGMGRKWQKKKAQRTSDFRSAISNTLGWEIPRSCGTPCESWYCDG